MLSLTLNADELLRELADIEEEATRVEEVVASVEDSARVSFTQVMGAVHAGWLATQGMVRAAGGTIQTVFRTLVGTTLGAIEMLAPLFTAQAVAGDYVRAAMGMASIGLALGAMFAMQQEEKEISDALRGANMALHGIQSLIGVFDF